MSTYADRAAKPRTPAAFPTKAAHIEHLWRTTSLDTLQIAHETGMTLSGVRGTLSKKQLKQDARPVDAPRSRRPGEQINRVLPPRPARQLAAVVPIRVERAPVPQPSTERIASVDAKARTIAGPSGTISHAPAATCLVVERLALGKPGDVFDEGLLALVGGFGERLDELRLHLSRIAPALAGIGIDLHSPLKGFWRVARITQDHEG